MGKASPFCHVTTRLLLAHQNDRAGGDFVAVDEHNFNRKTNA
jgi:hypothetical protein